MDAYIRDFQNNPIKATEVDYNCLRKLKESVNDETQYKIAQINIRSISQNFDKLLCLLDQIAVDFEFFILTETHQIDNVQLFHKIGYDTIYNEGRLNKCDGVVVLLKSTLNYTYNITNIGLIKIIEIKISESDPKNSLTISCIYRSPSINKDVFNHDFYQYLENAKMYKTHIITGDINMDLMSYNEPDDEYKNIFSYFNYISYINDITRPSSKTCLDHFLAKTPNTTTFTNIKSFIIKYELTDHYPIALTIDSKNKRATSKENIQLKQYINYDQLKNDLFKESWYTCTTNNVHEAFSCFIETLTFYVNKNTHTVTQTRKNTSKEKWINKKLIKLINDKNKLYKEHLQQPQNEQLKTQYKNSNNEVTKEIKRAKKEYLRSTISRNRHTSKNLWQVVNNLGNKQNSYKKQHIEKITTSAGHTLESSEQISEYFNNFFCEIGEKLAAQIEPTENYNEDREEYLESSFYLHNTNVLEVEKTINCLKTKKAPGFDGFKAETLQKVAKEISNPLTHIINLCFNTGIFPDVLKTGVIIPLHKSGPKDDVNNFRPVSLISNLSKIVEKILKYRLVKCFTKFKILSDKQFGFRQKRSTEDAILKLTSNLYDALDKNIPALCIFVDLSKAFDTVNHEILLKKLEIYGIRGIAKKLIGSYLKNRRQTVKVNSVQSSSREVVCGVPQGTVLGPLLFIIYVNSLLKITSLGDIISYCDDTVIFYSANTWQDLKTIAERDFLNISNWFKSNKLSLNVQKTKYISFTSYKDKLPKIGSLQVNQEIAIPETESIKYLGIILDQNLKWNLHVKHVTQKIRALISKFKYLKNYLDIKHLIVIYYSLVQSQINYGITGWGGARDWHIRQLNIVQKWIIKVIFEKNRTFPTDLLFKESKLFDIRQLYIFNLLICIHKNKICTDSPTHTHATRNRENRVQVPRRQKNIGQRHFQYIAPKAFNLLPKSVQNLVKERTFKGKVKNWIQESNRQVLHDLVNNRWNKGG